MTIAFLIGMIFSSPFRLVQLLKTEEEGNKKSKTSLIFMQYLE
jgi:hypothetical protein